MVKIGLLMGDLIPPNITLWRRHTIFMMGRLIKTDRTIGRLIECLKHKDQEVRVDAASILKEIRDVRAVEPLIQCLKDASREVRASAVKALGEILMYT